MKSLLDLEAQDCRWPSGDPKHPGFAFCGQPKLPARSYCCEHLKLAYDPKRNAPWVPGANKSGAETTRGGFHAFGVVQNDAAPLDCVDALTGLRAY